MDRSLIFVYRFLNSPEKKADYGIRIAADHALQLIGIAGGTGIICITIDMVGIFLILRCGKVAEGLNTEITEVHLLAVDLQSGQTLPPSE